MVNFVSGEFHLNFLKKRETAGEKVHPLGFNSFCSEHYYRNEMRTSVGNMEKSGTRVGRADTGFNFWSQQFCPLLQGPGALLVLLLTTSLDWGRGPEGQLSVGWTKQSLSATCWRVASAPCICDKVVNLESCGLGVHWGHPEAGDFLPGWGQRRYKVDQAPDKLAQHSSLILGSGLEASRSCPPSEIRDQRFLHPDLLWYLHGKHLRHTHLCCGHFHYRHFHFITNWP